MMDIKLMDSHKHRECTGVPNERILDNALRLGQQPQPLIVRTPVIPGVNDNPEEITAIARFAAQLPNLLYYELLPFHPMARGKYNSLDLDYRAAELTTPPKETMEALTAAAGAAGVPARHG
jgi:pyruvate formate lyase activating enzyme